jgi:eukaryotic translation initiation factor 2C
MVLSEELPSIRAALNDAANATTPKSKVPTITLIVCAKRHHLRLYPTSEALADGKGNPLPGTVVDRGGILDPNLFQFLLQPHAALQGSARSTLYTVLVDENKMSSDELQMLVNASSYTMARTTGAVSLITPVYYADLACTRGRSYLQKLFLARTNETGSVSGWSESSVYEEAEKVWHGGVTGSNLKDSMFYL